MTFLLLTVLLTASGAVAQRARGEIRLEVHDAQGASLHATAELISDSNQLHRELQVSDHEPYVAREIPFGFYQLKVRAEGFAEWSRVLEIRSEVPVSIVATLGPAPVTTHVDVHDSVTLIDPNATGAEYSIGRESLTGNVSPQPGRSLTDLVDELPGWLYEGNGVLHPRGSEYDVQYVVDGVPVTENRSPGFAPSLDSGEVESMRVLTASYPAEYGRKLGGVIEVSTKKDLPTGVHGRVDLAGGSFSSTSNSAAISYAKGQNRFAIDGFGFHTKRYLDPPVLENFTNTGNGGGLSTSYEREISERDRLRVSFSHELSRFQIPNYLVQEDAGQRQDSANTESTGQISLQHLISPDLLLSTSATLRDSSSRLFSNSRSTPIVATQDRGYREGYMRLDLAGHHGRHDWKAGVDSIVNPVRERLEYVITDPTQFDPGTLQQFQFSAHRWDIEPSAYVQDQVRLGDWNFSAGLRLDRYAFVVHETALSPRVGLSRYLRAANLVVHASYDRVFQTPAMENLLLASSPEVQSLSPVVVRLPVRPGHANYYELGVTKAILGHLRVDANLFRRDFRNYSDDDVLLDTGVSFPIAFKRGQIVGEELRVELLRWGRFSGSLSYANQSGIGQGPITGGLFLGSEALQEVGATGKFAVSQDQRNTVRVRGRFQATRMLWIALGGEYGSGLPAEMGETDINLLLAQYGASILNGVDLQRGRVRPSFSVDTAAGIEMYRKEKRSLELQVQGNNLADRMNVINFASLFSGTAVGAPRSITARLQIAF